MSFIGSVARGALRLDQDLGNAVISSGGAASYGASRWRVRTQRDLLTLYGSSAWFRLAIDVIGSRQASADWYLLAPATGSRRQSKMIKARALTALATPGLDSDGDTRAQHAVRKMHDAGDLIDVEEEFGPHPFLEMLRAGVPGQFDGYLATVLATAFRMLVGEEIHWLLRGPAGVPEYRIPIPPHWAIPPRLDQPGSTWQITFGHQSIMPPGEDMEWLRVPDPVNPYGRGSGVGGSLDHDAALYEETLRYLVSSFRNRTRPDLLIAGTYGTRERKALEKEFEKKLRGSEGAGLAFWLNMPTDPSAKLSVHDLGRSAADMETADLTKIERDAILQVCGTPPNVIGATESSNRATAHQAEISLRNNSILPGCESRRRHLQQRYLEPLVDRPAEYAGEDRLILGYRLPQLIDEQRRTELLRSSSWVFDGNELRKMAGIEPREDLERVHGVPTKTRLVDMGETGPVSEDSGSD